MENSTNMIYDRAKNTWSPDTLARQTAKQNTQTTITFSDNIEFICQNAISGQMNFVISIGTNSIIPILTIHKKLLLNNGTNVLISEFLNFIDNNQKNFTDEVNWFKYDEFEDLLNQMHWITLTRCNQGKAGSIKMNINDFKKFLNKTFNMKFNLDNGKTQDKDEKSNDKNNNNSDNKKQDKNQNENKENENNNQNNKNNNKNNSKSKFYGQHNHNFGNMNNNKKRSKQSTIMESMGARFREMVSDANTNDIHHPILRPIVQLPNLQDHKMTTYLYI